MSPGAMIAVGFWSVVLLGVLIGFSFDARRRLAEWEWRRDQRRGLRRLQRDRERAGYRTLLASESDDRPSWMPLELYLDYLYQLPAREPKRRLAQ